MKDRGNEGGDLSTWLSAPELSRSAPLTPRIENIRTCHLSMYYPLPKQRDNALLKGPIMRNDTIEVTQSQRHLIIKLDHSYLCSTFIFKSDQIKFICAALPTKRSDTVLHTATKGICRQSYTLKHCWDSELTAWHWGPIWIWQCT